jgi:predicted peptidase
MVDRINAWGGNAKLTIYPGVGHNCWENAYTDDGLIEWMLEQKRP